MTHSLRGRLLLGLALTIVITGLVAAVLTFRWAFDEAIEMQDNLLTQIANVGMSTRFQGGGVINTDADREAQVAISEYGDRPSTPEAQSIWSLADGLHIVPRGKASWRVMLRTRTDGSRFVIRQPTEVRDEIARDSALHTMLPLALLIPCLVFVVTFIIARSLRPVVRLASQLDSRRANDLTTIPSGAVPRELHPFIASINRLFGRIETLLDQERRFIADAAHELRTPITALSLQIENLDQLNLKDDGHARLATLKEGMQRTKHLLDQLLALARHDTARTPKDAVTAIDECAKNVVSNILPEAVSMGIDLGFEVIEPLSVYGEPVMLAAVIRNLLDNAIRYTPRGGRVDISIYEDGDRAVLRIRDTGPGIPPKDLQRVFEPFFRGSTPGADGTGLGLSIVKRIVDRLSGTIDFENISDASDPGLRVFVRLVRVSGDYRP